MVLNLNSMLLYNCIGKTILSEDSQSAYNILLSIFDDIIVNKVIYLVIYVEHKFSILNYKSWIFYTFLTTKSFLNLKFDQFCQNSNFKCL